MIIERYDIDKNPEYADLVIDALLAESEQVRKIGVDREYVKRVLRSSDVGCIVALDGFELMGTIIVLASCEWFNPSVKTATDLLVWVHPEKRGGSVFLKMLKRVEEWARNNGIVRLHLGQTTGIAVEKTADLYSRLGYDVVGFLSVKEI